MVLKFQPIFLFLYHPFLKKTEAEAWAKKLYEEQGFIISSMQSIWYGRQERLFGTGEERNILVEYTKKAIDFASAICCNNIVFGCPQNRNKPQNVAESVAIEFFKMLGDYAFSKNTCIGIEANPAVYNTNYINSTAEAIELIKTVNSPGFKLNLDIGTMIYNGESISLLIHDLALINHVHISEPGLEGIAKRSMHKELANMLMHFEYDGFISIEMSTQKDIKSIENTLKYVRSIFV